MTNIDTVVLDGELSLQLLNDGEFDLVHQLDGESGVV